MSVWGKLIGVAAGLALGGPLGALIGLVAGHALVDVPVSRRASSPEHIQVAFTIAAIALAAKLARADGYTSAQEVAAFQRLFHVAPEEAANVSRFFQLAQQSTDGFQAYATQAAQLLGLGSPILEDLIEALFLIAKADGALHNAEIEYLDAVASHFGLEPQLYNRIKARHGVAGATDPYSVLGVKPSAALEEVKAAYRSLVKTYHPDRHIAAGMPIEFIKVAEQRLAAINEAYHAIMAT